ncbi:MAG: hypothetical protein QG597_170, partial [Actinomycetota bacterium]|nr:hypothetical protein [Actinomycetota bacterium]
ANYVWHCALRNHDEDRALSDAEWEQIARQVITGMGFEECRWEAVRHADNHVHLAVTRVTESGRLVSLRNDYRRMGAIAADLEVAFAMEHVPDRDRGKAGVSRAELDRARQAGHTETARDGLARKLRAAAMVARNEGEFVTRVRQDGLQLKPRRDEAGQVVGYAVADPSSGPLWYGGRTLSPDLSLPRLRHRWAALPQPRPAGDDATSPTGSSSGSAAEAATGTRPTTSSADRDGASDPVAWSGTGQTPARTRLREEAWAQARAVVDDVHTRLRDVPPDDAATWAAACGELAGVLAALSGRLEVPGRPGPLARAATSLALAAQTGAMARYPRDPYPSHLTNMWGVSRAAQDAYLPGHEMSPMNELLMSVQRTAGSIGDIRAARADSRRSAQIIAAYQAVEEWLQNPVGPPPPQTALVFPGYRPAPTAQPTPPPQQQRPAQPPARRRTGLLRWLRRRGHGDEDRSR